jgi:hypothetical protein
MGQPAEALRHSLGRPPRNPVHRTLAAVFVRLDCIGGSIIYMKITLSLDAELVKKVRELAARKNTTLPELVRLYLKKIAAEETAGGSKNDDHERLQRTFEQFQFWVGKRHWKRQHVYHRS